ncbi:hypothetical protein PMAYCL1PPCAC_11130, partial [Pristionchus mayeri]
FRSLIYAVVMQLVLMFMMSFVFCAWAVAVVEYQHNGYLEHDEVLQILADRPLAFWITLPTKVLPDKHSSFLFLAYLLFTVNSLGYVITTGEYLLVSMLRGLPFLVRVNKVMLRSTTLLMLTAASTILTPLLLDSHVFRNETVHYVYLTMMLVAIFYEMTIFIYVYGLQRVLVNLKVVYRTDKKGAIIFSRLTPYLKFIYRYILSWLLCLGLAHATNFYVLCRFSFLNNINILVLITPWIVGLWKIGRHAQTTHPIVTLFRCDARFGPAAVADRRTASIEENKMGAAGLQ